jgi:hypothetical protein
VRCYMLLLLLAASCGGRVDPAQSLAASQDAATDMGEGGGSAGGAGQAGKDAGADDSAADAAVPPAWPDGAEAACATYAAHACQLEKPCQGANTFQLFYGDLSGCLQVQTRICLDRFFAPGSTFTVPDMHTCNAALAASTECGWLWPDACRPGPGTKQDGASCSVDTQCVSRFCCSTVQTCGTCCTAPQNAQPCWEGRCAAGLGCLPLSQICMTQSGEGEACGGSSNPCAPGLHCQKGVCTATTYLKEGEPCAPTDLCAGFMSCGASGACKDTIQGWVGEDENCDWYGSVVCERGFVCPSPAPSTCVPGRKVGEPCSTDSSPFGSNCGDGLWCEEGQCAEPGSVAWCP